MTKNTRFDATVKYINATLGFEEYSYTYGEHMQNPGGRWQDKWDTQLLELFSDSEKTAPRSALYLDVQMDVDVPSLSRFLKIIVWCAQHDVGLRLWYGENDFGKDDDGKMIRLREPICLFLNNNANQTPE